MPVGAEQRQRRQQMILDILRTRPVLRQEQLVRLLGERGIHATQSSISRDLKQLGIAKLGEAYRPVDEEAPAASADERLLAGFVLDIRTAGPNLAVIITAEGAAQRLAVYLDRSGWPEIVGTVSGDDTIFVACRDSAGQRRLLARLRAKFPADSYAGSREDDAASREELRHGGGTR